MSRSVSNNDSVHLNKQQLSQEQTMLSHNQGIANSVVTQNSAQPSQEKESVKVSTSLTQSYQVNNNDQEDLKQSELNFNSQLFSQMSDLTVTPSGHLRESMVYDHEIDDSQPQTEFQMADSRLSRNQESQCQAMAEESSESQCERDKDMGHSQDSALPIEQSTITGSCTQESQVPEAIRKEPQESMTQNDEMNCNDQQLELSQGLQKPSNEFDDALIQHIGGNVAAANNIRLLLEQNRQLIEEQIRRDRDSHNIIPYMRLYIMFFIGMLFLSAFSIRLYSNVILSNSVMSSMSIKQTDAEVRIQELKASLMEHSQQSGDIEMQVAQMRDLLRNQSQIIMELSEEVSTLRIKIKQKRSTIDRILRFLGLYYEEDDDTECFQRKKFQS